MTHKLAGLYREPTDLMTTQNSEWRDGDTVGMWVLGQRREEARRLRSGTAIPSFALPTKHWLDDFTPCGGMMTSTEVIGPSPGFTDESWMVLADGGETWTTSVEGQDGTWVHRRVDGGVASIYVRRAPPVITE